MRILRKLLRLIFLLLLLLACIGVGYYFAITKDTRLEPEKLTLNEHTVLLYDRYGNEIKNVSALYHKQTVKIDEISQDVQQAVICTEDKRFYKHNGFDFKRIARAAVNNLKSRSFKEGASTISQQLIKNTHLSQEKTIKRKLKEWKLTRKLEKSYAKEEILEKYLNTIYFGHSCFGIRAAAEFYFQKEPRDLTLSDAAVLAALIKSPNHYSPFKNPEGCQKRKAVVLSLLRQNGYITEGEYAAAKKAPLPNQPQERQNNGYLTFVFDELEELSKENRFRVGGNIRIFTEFDPALQERLNEIALQADGCDKAMLVLDGETKRFKAALSTVGNAPRLPGSLIKPLLVYAPALEENLISPATPILDEQVNYGGYKPENYNGKYHGYLSARECLAKSLNIPAVKLLQSLGAEKGAKYLSKLGLAVSEEDYSLALALGGMKKGFPLQDIATAYSALQNDGKVSDTAFIKEIRINDVCVHLHKPTSKQVFSAETAYLTTDMLQTAVKDGTAKKLRDLPFPIAAKTGTVGTEKGNTDAYALSYTAKDVAAVWLGNGNNSLFSHTGGGLPCALLRQINEVLASDYTEKNTKIPPFKKPSGVVEIAIDKQSYYDTHTILLADEFSPVDFRFSELFKKDAVPTKKSDFFSNPSISTPTVSLTENGVKITFQTHTPTVYQYKIERYDYITHTTLYQGEFLPEFLDKTVEENKRYLYTVTPIYAGKCGKAVQLPEISTKELRQDKIAEKEWWQY